MKEAYNVWLRIYRDFPKVERMGLGKKIEHTFLDELEITFCLSYLSPENKIPFLNKAITKNDVLKFLTQLAWESKIMSMNKYSEILPLLEEIGRQLGAWKKGMESKLQKTPQK